MKFKNLMAEFNLPIKLLTENAVRPTRAHQFDAGLDLTCTSVNYDHESYDEYGTGVAVAIPEGYFGLLAPRSSCSKRGVQLLNSVGVIDSGYRGEIMLRYTKAERYKANSGFKIGERIGQLLVLPIVICDAAVVEELPELDNRGKGGFGSSGS